MVLTPEWSAPTEIVTIPNGSGVLAGGIKPPKGSDQIRAKLILTAIDPEKGIEAAVEKEFERGAVANAVESDVKARDPITAAVTDIPKVRFQSNMVVLDIYGGRTLGKRGSTLTTPAEVLMLDGSGNLTVHGELDDQAAYDSAKPPEDSEERARKKTNRPAATRAAAVRASGASRAAAEKWRRLLLSSLPRRFQRCRKTARTSCHSALLLASQPSLPSMVSRDGVAIGANRAAADRGGESSGLDPDSAGRYLSRSHL